MTYSNGWMARWGVLILILAGGIGLSMAAGVLAHRVETRRIHSLFDFRADWREKDMEGKIASLAVPVAAMASYLGLHDKIGAQDTQKDFATFAEIRSSYTHLRPRNFLFWALVKAPDRAAYEEHMRLQTGDVHFSILDGNAAGTDVKPAPGRPLYFPLTHRKFLEGIPVPLGLDVATYPHRLPLNQMERAWKDGVSVGSGPFAAWGTPGVQNVQFTVPVYRSGAIPATEAERRATLIGFMSVSYELERILDFAIANTPKIIEDIYLSDGSADRSRALQSFARFSARENRFILEPMAVPAALDQVVVTKDLDFSGQSWRLLFYFPQAEADRLRSFAPWLFFIAGLALTALLALGEEIMQRRREQLRLEVAAGRTQLRATEGELAAANMRLSTLIEASPVAIICLDKEGRVMLWNPAAERMFGYSSKEILSQSCPIPIPWSSHSLPGRISTDEGLYKAKDGRPVNVSYTACSFYDENAHVAGSIIVASDVTEKRSLENQLHHAQKMESMGQLTGGIAHDFNNLLGVAIGNLDLLEGETSPKGEPLRAATLGAMLRGSDLVRALLAFSRRQPLNPSLVNINERLERLVELLRHTLGEAIEVKLTTQEGLWQVHIDSVQLESAITNLAINARDAMPKGGKVTIATHNAVLDEDYASQNPEAAPGDYACIEVTDNGSGMTPEVLANACEPFFTTKEKGKGTGLGLSMVYGFIKQSGGHLKIYSEVGYGTVVRIYLPRAEAAAGEMVKEQAAPAALAMGKGETVLVVEDNTEMRRMVISQLDSLGYRVIEAANGRQAFDIIEKGTTFDILFSDVVMPGGLSGFDVARHARIRYPTLCILLTSGFPGNLTAEEQEIEPGLRVELLGKPYRKHDLARKIRETLDHRT